MREHPNTRPRELSILLGLLLRGTRQYDIVTRNTEEGFSYAQRAWYLSQWVYAM